MLQLISKLRDKLAGSRALLAAYGVKLDASAFDGQTADRSHEPTDLSPDVAHIAARACGTDDQVQRANVAWCGVRRYLGEHGRLVFHRSRHGLQPDAPESSYSTALILRRAGVSQRFIDRVASTPATSAWAPTKQELIDAGVVHEIGDPLPVAGLR